MDRRKNKNQAGSRRILLVCCFVLASARASAAGVEVDGGSGTSLDAAPNGVPIVNIARPNSSGLSHNTYRKFNVDPSGLILNNANQTVVNTQLSGQILGNPNLGAPARVILNEVTSTNRSYLNGYTEVAGQAADVVIANPNGISVNGAGFINTPRVTLTTGLPEIDGFGNLSGFDVRGGDIAIDGDGLNTQLQDFTSIYTHFLRLNAKLHARDLDVALGVNQVDYPGRKIVSTGRGTVNRVLLDSSALGGMYANKIVLVGTDQGLGMKLPPEVIASVGDIRISSDGRLVLQKLDAQGDIRLLTNAGIESTGTVFGAGDIDVDARDELDVKSGMIAASGQVTIDADRIINSGSLVSGLDADGSMNDQGLMEIRVLDLANAGEIIASDRLDITAASAVNQGLINAYNNLSVSADVLVNEATLFSGSNAQLLVQSDLTNTTGGSIFAVNDLLMAADNLAGRTTRITNDLGLIQSLQGDIDIHATRFDNLGHGDLQYQLIYYDLGNGREVNNSGEAMTIDLAYSSGYTKHRNRARSRWVNEVLSRLSRQAPLLYQANANDIRANRSARFLAIETRLQDNSSTTPAFLDSGNDLNLHVDEFVNHNSVTAAARDINFNISGDYLNQAFSATERVTDYQYSTRAKHSDNWKDEDKYSSIGRSFYIPVVRNKTVSTNTVTQAGRNITGNIGGRAVNSGVLVGQTQPAGEIDPADFSRENISLPVNDFGLFVKSRAPDSQYLIETNPRFTRYGNFVSSSYLLDRLDFSANATLKRLGDAFYEAKLIRDSVFAQSGRRYLDPAIQSDNDQFQYLMDNALIAQGELRLAPGVALKRDQINRLTRDIVWLEPQEVGGEMVLVPTVYLVNGPRMRVRGGRVIAGGDSALVVASLKNDGLIEAGNSLAIETEAEVHNRGAIVAGETLSIVAAGDVENISGRIKGRNVAITSTGGSIINRRQHEDYVYTQKDLSYSTTLIGAGGVIEAENELLLEADRGIEVSGSDIQGGQISLKATTVDITTTVQSENYFAGDKKNHVTESSTRHFASTINGDDIVILSLGKTRVDGS
ncbi:MAG: filamentous hemagglutinin N-terminal domain-containing protein, partial [Gammaproteobacteria bacterium]|nr:filamentous hemagglutinin N-terminal domain-containing protein [Gammaproteobacteria bacterium]